MSIELQPLYTTWTFNRKFTPLSLISFKYTLLSCQSAKIIILMTSHPNPLMPSAHRRARIAKISILKLEGTIKKIQAAKG